MTPDIWGPIYWALLIYSLLYSRTAYHYLHTRHWAGCGLYSIIIRPFFSLFFFHYFNLCPYISCSWVCINTYVYVYVGARGQSQIDIFSHTTPCLSVCFWDSLMSRLGCPASPGTALPVLGLSTHTVPGCFAWLWVSGWQSTFPAEKNRLFLTQLHELVIFRMKKKRSVPPSGPNLYSRKHFVSWSLKWGCSWLPWNLPKRSC